MIHKFQEYSEDVVEEQKSTYVYKCKYCRFGTREMQALWGWHNESAGAHHIITIQKSNVCWVKIDPLPLF